MKRIIHFLSTVAAVARATIRAVSIEVLQMHWMIRPPHDIFCLLCLVLRIAFVYAEIPQPSDSIDENAVRAGKYILII